MESRSPLEVHGPEEFRARKENIFDSSKSRALSFESRTGCLGTESFVKSIPKVTGRASSVEMKQKRFARYVGTRLYMLLYTPNPVCGKYSGSRSPRV